MAKTLALILSLAVTPICIFVSAALDLFWGNQEDLFGQPDVLWQFYGAAALLWLAGGLLYLLVRSAARLRWMLGCYYLAGPVFLVYGHVHSRYPRYLDHWAAVGLVLAVVAGTSIWMTRRFTLPALSRFFAPLAILLLLGEIATPIWQGAAPRASWEFQPAAAQLKPPAPKLPNVYHLILDEFQEEMFLAALTEAAAAQLSGFRLFRDTRASYTRTTTAVASILLGYELAPGSEIHEYQAAAFRGQ